MHPANYWEIKARQDLNLRGARNRISIRKRIRRHPIQALGGLLISLGFKLTYSVNRVDTDFDETIRILRTST